MDHIKPGYKRGIRSYNVYTGEFYWWGSQWAYDSRHRTYFRHPRTTQEQRMNEAHFEYVRGRRRKLPTAWDDLNYSRRGGKSWKDYTRRKKQYKAHSQQPE